MNVKTFCQRKIEGLKKYSERSKTFELLIKIIEPIIYKNENVLVDIHIGEFDGKHFTSFMTSYLKKPTIKIGNEKELFIYDGNKIVTFMDLDLVKDLKITKKNVGTYSSCYSIIFSHGKNNYWYELKYVG